MTLKNDLSRWLRQGSVDMAHYWRRAIYLQEEAIRKGAT